MTKVFYASRYGATQKYAQWLAEDLDCPCINVKKARTKDLSDCDTVIFGGGLYASKINGIKFIKENLPALEDKRVVVFTVGLSPEADPSLKKIQDSVFSSREQEKIEFFHLRGELDMKKLSFMHRKMMGMLRKMLAKTPESERTDTDNKILSSFEAPVSFVDRENIKQICDSVEQ